MIADEILDRVKEKDVVRDDIIPLYAKAIYWNDVTDVTKINKAIMDKWSASGLEYIKKGAWKQLEKNTKIPSKKSRK